MAVVIVLVGRGIVVQLSRRVLMLVRVLDSPWRWE